jgi:hypothetical protein
MSQHLLTIFKCLPLLILMVCTSCVYKDFGYKQNPLNVMVLAHKAIMKDDVDKLKTYLGGEAKCLYGNEEGLKVVKEQISKKLSKYRISLHKDSASFREEPRYIGYLSFYTEVYRLDIFEGLKEGEKQIAEVKVVCDFGYQGTVEQEEATESNVQNMPIKKCKVHRVNGNLYDHIHYDEACRSLQNYL